MKSIIFLLVFALAVQANSQTNVHINLDTKHTVGDISSFERSKWIVVHESTSGGELNSEPDKRDYLMGDLDAYYGRETGHVTTEVSSRTPEAMVGAGSSYRTTYGNNTDWQKYEHKEGLVIGNQHRIYEEMSATEAGLRSGTYLKNYFGTGGTDGRLPPVVFELLNEPLFPLHDFPPAGKPKVPISEIFEYHKEMATKIKEISPETKVAGYVAAFSIFEENNFNRWTERWKSYIDLSGDELDVYSFHFYDFPGINNGIEQYRKGANNEATLDMVEHYTKLVNKEKPILISEYGSQLHDWYDQPWSSYRDWLVLKATNSMLLQFMERPDRIMKTVPFTIIKGEWGFGNGSNNGYPYYWRMMRKANEPESYSGDWVWTEYIKFYELWANVNGTRVDTKPDDINIQVDAFVDGNKAYIIVNNLMPSEKPFHPKISGIGTNQISSLSVKNLYWDGEKVVFSETDYTYSDDLTLDLQPEATMVLEYTLINDVVVDNTSDETKYYADKYLQPILANTPQTYQVTGVTTANDGEAVLRIGIGRNKNQSRTPEVKVNGTTLESEMLYRGDDQAQRPLFFGLLEIEVPYDLIQSVNTVEVTFPDAGGHVSSLGLQIFNFSRAIIRTEIESLRLDLTQITIASGKSRKLTATIAPVNASNKKVTWTSDNDAIATVNQEGTVTAVSEGTATITVTTDAKNSENQPFVSTCTVTVDDSFVLKVGEIILSPTSINVGQGETAQVSALVLPTEADNKNLDWTSRDESIATVDANGLISGVALGTTTITATANDGSGISESVPLTVLNPAFIQFDDDSKYLTGSFESGTSMEISCSYSAGGGTTVSDDGIKFWLREITPNFGAVVIDYTSIVASVAGSSSGTATSTISLEGVTPTESLPDGNFYFLYLTFDNSAGERLDKGIFPINITPGSQIDVVTVLINPKTAALNVGSTLSFTTGVIPANATDKSLTWSSDNIAVATVDASGVVTGVSPGNAKITVKSVSNPSATNAADIEVLVPLVSITLEPQNIELKVDESKEITVNYTPENATYKELIWSSDNTGIATVDEAGKVTALSEGKAMIAATSVNQSTIEAKATVNVTLVLSSLEASNPSILVYPNPTNGFLNFDRLPFETYRLFVYDVSGKQLIEKSIEHQVGEKSLRINLCAIPKGLCNVKLASDSDTYSFTILIE